MLFQEPLLKICFFMVTTGRMEPPTIRGPSSNSVWLHSHQFSWWSQATFFLWLSLPQDHPEGEQYFSILGGPLQNVSVSPWAELSRLSGVSLFSFLPHFRGACLLGSWQRWAWSRCLPWERDWGRNMWTPSPFFHHPSNPRRSCKSPEEMLYLI